MKKQFRTLSLLLMAALLFALAAPAAMADTSASLPFASGEWEGSQAGTVRQTMYQTIHSEATICFDNGGTFTGACRKDGYPNGEGTYTFADGESVYGEFIWASDMHRVMEKGSRSSDPHYGGTDLRYTGMTLNGEPYGYGELNFKDGGTFYGEFRDGAVDGQGVYVYLEPNGKSYVSGDSWKIVSRVPSSLGGRWYSGLTLNGAWEGFGMLCYNYSYYVGEVRGQYCDGHGVYWTWTQYGDPSGSLSISKYGHYSAGNLQYSCNHAGKFPESFDYKIASSSNADSCSSATY